MLDCMVKGCLVYKFVVIIFIPLQVRLEEFAAYILQCNNIDLMYITLELICRQEWWIGSFRPSEVGQTSAMNSWRLTIKN